MITEAFFQRHPNEIGFGYEGKVAPAIDKFFNQAAQILFDDLRKVTPGFEGIVRSEYEKLVREVGHDLSSEREPADRCYRCLTETYDLWSDEHGSAQEYVNYRLSLVELLFAEIGQSLPDRPDPTKPKVGTIGHYDKSRRLANLVNNQAHDGFRNGVNELNRRLEVAGIPFSYDAGKLRKITDKPIQENIHNPFWELIDDAKWKSVAIEMEEALRRRDRGDRDSPLSAMKALESTIKIISDERRLTTGKEGGAANYIENLASKRGGKLIEKWEGDALKFLFCKIRNPHGHGSGSEAPPDFSRAQMEWVIDSAMAWVKSLVGRL